MAEWIPFIMFLTVCLVLMAGYPVAFSLAGTALIFAFFGMLTGYFDPAFLQALPNRLYGIMQNGTLIAVPLFVLMGNYARKIPLSGRLTQQYGLTYLVDFAVVWAFQWCL
jgi:TRAP-type mannitol/chloroaromatic compound transport system permease large subunit